MTDPQQAGLFLLLMTALVPATILWIHDELKERSK